MAADKNPKTINRIIIAGVIIVGIVVFRYFDLGQYLTLDYIKASQEKFQVLYQAHRFSVVAAYMVIYIAVTGLSLPGAAVLTLAGGGLFGLVVGTVAVSFASTTLEAFTAAKMMRKPALPIVAMLERSEALATIKVRTDVMSSPSNGLFQYF